MTSFRRSRLGVQSKADAVLACKRGKVYVNLGNYSCDALGKPLAAAGSRFLC